MAGVKGRSGGHRVGAGRKPKDAALRALDGGRGSHSAKVLPGPGTAASDSSEPWLIVDEEHAPDDLTREERLVWLEWAPHALENFTLVPSKVLAFKQLCRDVVSERDLRKVELFGPAHARAHRAVVNALGDFGLRPFGKPSAGAAEKPAVDPMKEKYFGGR